MIPRHAIVGQQVSRFTVRYFCRNCGRPWPWVHLKRCGR